MMKKLQLIESLLALSCVLLNAPANAAPHNYPSDSKAAIQISGDLYDSLDAKYRNHLDTKPVTIQPSDTPGITFTTQAGQPAQMAITEGLVTLINRIAHARAIDRTEPGYFDRYMTALSTMTSAPAIQEDRYWTDEVLNDQGSYFNQIMGLTVAINLSRCYLGQSGKHAAELQAAPINAVLTPSEWESGVHAGAVNSLTCAFGTDGAKALFEAIGKMPQRPAWAAYFVPAATDIQKLNKQLAKYEVDFFHGRLN